MIHTFGGDGLVYNFVGDILENMGAPYVTTTIGIYPSPTLTRGSVFHGAQSHFFGGDDLERQLSFILQNIHRE